MLKFFRPTAEVLKIDSLDPVSQSKSAVYAVGDEIAPGQGSLEKCNRLNYRDKFRARVKTVLKNVRDLEIEEYDNQDRQACRSGGNLETQETLATNHTTLSSGLGVGDDPVDESNAVMFARKAFLILGLQLLLSALWVLGVCQDDSLFDQVYPESSVLTLVAGLGVAAIFSTLYFAKKVFGTIKTHVFISTVLTVSLSYLYGALAEYMSYKLIITSFMMSFSFIVGVVGYCRVTNEEYFCTRKSSFSGCTTLSLFTVSLYLWNGEGIWTLFGLYIVSSLFGIALVIRTKMTVGAPQEQFLMKHYIFFSMVLYLNFVKTAIYAGISTFGSSSKTRTQSPEKPQISQQPESEAKSSGSDFFTLRADIGKN